MDADLQPSVVHYAEVLRRQAWLILLVVILTAAAAAAAVSQQTSIYRASSKIVVGQNGGIFQAQFGNAVDPFTQTMTNLLKSEIVARQVITDLHLDLSTHTVLSRTHVLARPNESVLEVSYDTPNAASAVPVLRQIGIVFARIVKDRLGHATVGTGTGTNASLAPVTATVFDPPHLLSGRISPRPTRTIALAAGLGLILGIILAMVRDSLDQGVRSTREAEEWFGAPVLGRLPPGVRGAQASGLEATTRRSLEVDLALNLLTANLQFNQETPAGGKKVEVLLATSARPDEGKSTVVSNLGVTLAQAGHSVICVEADLRRPRLAHYFNLSSDSVGLFDVFDGRVDPTAALQRVSLRAARSAELVDGHAGELMILGAGRVNGLSPSGIFTAERIEALVSQLSKKADYVIFDSPPLLVAADAYPIVLVADRVLAVARYRRTSRESAENLRAALAGLGAKSVGLVLMDWPSESAYGYGYSLNQ
jgi:Mrp family chromosome partitioning ATPase/DNA-binding transcriptional regulator of glucitol operon